MDSWSNSLRNLNHREFANAAAESLVDNSPPDHLTGIDITNAEMEIWAEDAEGAYRVTELNGEAVATTVDEARKSKLWPLYQAAMQEEIKGKMENRAKRRTGLTRASSSSCVEKSYGLRL